MRRDRVYAWLVTHPVPVDAAIALALLPVTLVEVPAHPALALLLGALLCAPLVWRRRRPALSAAAVLAASAASTTLVPPPPGAVVLGADGPLLAALYGTAAYAPRRARRLVLVALAALLLLRVALAVLPGRELAAALGSAAAVLLLAVVATTLGDLRRMRRAYVVQLERSAAALRREQQQRSLLAAAEERARIAREMHDIVAHSLSVVVAQADGGQYAAQQSPERAVAALATIADTGRTTLADMRAVLGVLRDDDPARRAPQPGVEDVDGLVEAIRGSGLPVELRHVGRRRPVPPGPGLAAYRIVQEALTNVLKHAGRSAAAAVELRWGREELQVLVEDDGGGARAVLREGTGHGVEGMRERAALHGGQVDVEPRPGGGVRVSARLPLRRAEVA